MAEKELTYIIRVRDDGTAVISKLQSAVKGVTDQKKGVDDLSTSFKNLGGNVASDTVKKFGKDVESTTTTAKKQVDSLSGSFTTLGNTNLKNISKEVINVTNTFDELGKTATRTFTTIPTTKLTKDIQETSKVTKTAVDDISKSFQAIGVGPAAATTKKFTDDLQTGTKQAKANIDQVKMSFDTVGSAAIASGQKIKSGFEEPIERVKKVSAEATSSFTNLATAGAIAGGTSRKVAEGYNNISKELKATSAASMDLIKQMGYQGLAGVTPAAMEAFKKGQESFARSLQTTEKIRETTKATQSWISSLGSGFWMLSKWTVGIGSFVALLSAVKTATIGSVLAFADYDAVLNRTLNSFKTYGYTVGLIKKEIEDWSKSVQNKTKFSDDQALQTLNAMTFVTGDYRKAIELSNLAMRVSKRTGDDLESTYRGIQLAATGNVEAIGRQIPSLRGAQVLFSEYATDVEKSGWALAQYNKMFPETKEAQDTLSVSISKLDNAWKDLLKTWGEALKPAAQTIITTLTSITKSVTESITTAESEKNLRIKYAQTKEAEEMLGNINKMKDYEKKYQEWRKNELAKGIITGSLDIKTPAEIQVDKERDAAIAQGRDIRDTKTLQAEAKLWAKLKQLAAQGEDESQKVVSEIRAKYAEQRIPLEKVEAGKKVPTDVGAAKVLGALAKAEASDIQKALNSITAAEEETRAKILESEGSIIASFEKRRQAIEILYAYDKSKKQDAIKLLNIEIEGYSRAQKIQEIANVGQLTGLKEFQVEAALAEKRQSQLTDEYRKATEAVKASKDALADYKIVQATMGEVEAKFGIEKQLYGAIDAQRILIDLEKQSAIIKALGTKDEEKKIDVAKTLSKYSREDLDIKQRATMFGLESTKQNILSSIASERGLTIEAERMRAYSEEASQQLKITELSEKQARVITALGNISDDANGKKKDALIAQNKELDAQVGKEREILGQIRIQNEEKLKTITLQKQVSTGETLYAMFGAMSLATKEGNMGLQATLTLLDREMASMKEIVKDEQVLANYRAVKTRESRVKFGAPDLTEWSGWEESMISGVDKFKASVGSMQSDIADFTDTTLKNFSDGAANAVAEWASGTKTMSQAFNDFAKSFLTDSLKILQRMMLMQFWKGILSGIGGGTTPTSTASPGVTPAGSYGGPESSYGIMHGGGIVGETALAYRSMPQTNWGMIPRLHGGLNADEFPAILQKGEKVTPKGEVGKGQNIKVEIINQTGQDVKAEQGPVRIDFDGIIVGVVLKNIENRGPLYHALKQ